MAEASRRFELHPFQEGGHGFGTGPRDAAAGNGPQRFDRWLQRL